MSKTLLLCVASAIVASTAVFLAMKEPSKTEGAFYPGKAPTHRADNKVRQPDKYNPAYGILGLPTPAKIAGGHEWTAFTCTYMPPYSLKVAGHMSWQYVEVALLQGKPVNITFRPVKTPTTQQLADCETRANFLNMVHPHSSPLGTFLPFYQ